jgi:hypothetical protein
LFLYQLCIVQQAFVEICLLSGVAPPTQFKHFCHAWGRDATFVSRLTNQVCDRRGEFDRMKHRSDITAGASNNFRVAPVGIYPSIAPIQRNTSTIADDITAAAATAVVADGITGSYTNCNENGNHMLDMMDSASTINDTELLILTESTEETNNDVPNELAQA